MGSETTEIALRPASEVTVIMMAGLQGAGKTTTTAKLAGKFKSKGRKPLLVACDVYRPAAITQLQINGEKQGVEVFSMGDKQNPVNIAKAAVEHAKSHGFNVVILDTAGRLHVDEAMMEELQNIKEAVHVDQTILVVDAMTGQDAVNVADSFNQKLELDGVILTKLDGDTRGGAALSIKATCGKPILYVGMGEKLSDLEQFYPERMASRILGMGDVMTLIEKAQANIDEDKAREMEQKLKKAQFGFDDYLESMAQVKNMGGISSILSMMPGIGNKAADIEAAVDESKMARIEAIILSMTPKERSNPDLLNPSRKKRIAKGAGVDISKPFGNLIVDIGAGTTDVAVISVGGVVVSASIKVAGDNFNHAIMNYVREKHSLFIGEDAAEKIKIEIGTASEEADLRTMEVKGRNIITGLPKVVTLTSEEIRTALRECTGQIVEAVHGVLEKTPPELAADIMDRGIVLTGGGAMLHGMDALIEQKTGVSTLTVQDAMLVVAAGTGKYAEIMSRM